MAQVIETIKESDMYRQGDILIVRVEKVKGQATHHTVLAEGEVTGHKHELKGGTVFVAPGELYFTVTEDTPLVHEEHETIVIPEGSYRVIRQREYDEGTIRYVSD